MDNARNGRNIMKNETIIKIYSCFLFLWFSMGKLFLLYMCNGTIENLKNRFYKMNYKSMYCVTYKKSKIIVRRWSQNYWVDRWKCKNEIKTEDNNIISFYKYIDDCSWWSGIINWKLNECQDGRDHKYKLRFNRWPKQV